MLIQHLSGAIKLMFFSCIMMHKIITLHLKNNYAALEFISKLIGNISVFKIMIQNE